MFIHGACLATWERFEYDLEGNLVSFSTKENLITNDGRAQMFRNTFSMPGSGGFISMCVGASSTAAAVTDHGLTYELIGNPTRKVITNTSSASLTVSDVILETTTIGTTTFYSKVVVQGNWTAGDGNNGNQFGEYGLNTSISNPATPTALSGVLLNHFIDPAPVFKNAGNTVAAQITLRF